MKALTRRQVYLMLPVGATGVIVETVDLKRPGLVTIRVDDEMLLIWTRDLQHCSEAGSSPLRVINRYGVKTKDANSRGPSR
jgi:hypothetical protein